VCGLVQSLSGILWSFHERQVARDLQRDAAANAVSAHRPPSFLDAGK
jgi:hypothetical protein